jgi:hypothetical protein
VVTLSISDVGQQFVSLAENCRHQLPPKCLVVTAAGSASRYQHMLLLTEDPSDSMRHLVVLGPGQKDAPQGSSGEAVAPDALRNAIRSSAPLSLSPDALFSLFVDVSCLSRQQLGEIMAAVKDIAHTHTVHLELAYSLGRFVPPPEAASNVIQRIAPVNAAFSGWTNAPGKPVDVVLGLGYEKGKALGAVEYLEPRSTWIFVPNSPEHRYLVKVREHNKELLRRDPKQQLPYNVIAPVDTFYTMLSLVTGIALESRPILLPFGPKLFFALALLVAIVVDEASVWFVDGDDPVTPVATLPSDHAVVVSCRIQPN